MSERVEILKERYPGPRVAIVAGLHGNENIGVIAAERITEKLKAIGYKGSICVLKANVPALEKGVRFIDTDMNRLWYDDQHFQIESFRESQLVEEREAFVTHQILSEFFSNFSHPGVLIDLHGTSSKSIPFNIAMEHAESLQIASTLYVPSVRWPQADGILQRTLSGYAARKGLIATVFEAGPLYDLSSADLLEACLWDVLSKLDSLVVEAEGDVGGARKMLAHCLSTIPKFVEIVHEHRLAEGDNFVMLPGFENFTRVHEGMPLGKDRNGEVVSPCDGYLLFPLYQGVSDYGFAVAIAGDGSSRS